MRATAQARLVEAVVDLNDLLLDLLFLVAEVVLVVGER